MKKIFLSVAAIMLVGATALANGPVSKHGNARVKKECQGRCMKTFKSGTCKGKATCPDMKTCEGKCS